MRRSQLIAIFIALWVSSTFALAARADSPYETAVQYALEHLTSGISTASQFGETEVMVMPMRTWKSVSGHYCRLYEITITKSAANPDHAERTRCRDGDGTWKIVKEN